ncbi:hypothetical protein [Mycolicibacterium agri]|nr:hypothetical protein [Mycolicibacterium agri]
MPAVRLEKQSRTTELLSLHVVGNEAAFLAPLTVAFWSATQH